ncbi:MAG: arsenic efflux protein [Clostridia bacterium]|nr:arsenic efflux protein [Clostridia bacterium]
MWDTLVHSGLHALEETAKLLPFLFVAYLLMEYLEHHAAAKMEGLLRAIGPAGPLVGAVLGCIPQCGFSATASNLYAAGLVSRGTLLAVFLSTSDEALPLLLGHSNAGSEIAKLLLSKLLIGIAVGFAVDLLMRKFGKPRELTDLCEHCGCHDHGGILRPALWHTLRIALFCLVLNFLLHLGFDLLGQERLASLLLSGSWAQPFLAALVGLVPNCAASVMLTQLYLGGVISFGSVLAGLCAGAGVGLAVLLRVNGDKKESLRIVATLYLVSAVVGLIAQIL